MDLDRPGRIRVTCARMLSPYLSEELAALGFAVETTMESYADVRGTLRDAMRLNLYLHTAMSVLYELKEFPCDSPEMLYEAVREMAWEKIIPEDGYLSVISRASHPSITNWMYASLKVKDAIVDRISEQCGRRPDSGSDRTGVVVNLFWEDNTAAIFLNTSGGKLSDRGYRRRPHKAPMQETLAAGVVLATGYTGEQTLVNPMCGSGTIATEAALIATGRAPGLLRSDFGIMKVKGFDAEPWSAIRREAMKTRRKEKPTKIIATDRDPKAIDAAIANAKTAGVDHAIEFTVCNFEETPIPPGGGIVILNPEYGERLGEIKELEETYEHIGDFFKQKCAGYTGYIFTGNLELAKKVGLKASRRIIFYNAQIECRLLKYEMYEGTRKKPKADSP